jgi:hypothetical protein
MAGGKPFSQFAPQPQQQMGSNPFAQFAPSAQPKGMDFSRPVEEVRADIAKLPESERPAALEPGGRGARLRHKEEQRAASASNRGQKRPRFVERAN